MSNRTMLHAFNELYETDYKTVDEVLEHYDMTFLVDALEKYII